MKNLGEKTAFWLVDAGVRSRADMARLGPIEVCRRMLLAGHPVSLVAAYAIEGALTGTHWNQIPPAKKLEIQRLFAVMKREIAAGITSPSSPEPETAQQRESSERAAAPKPATKTVPPAKRVPAMAIRRR